MKVRAVDDGYVVSLEIGLVPGETDEEALFRDATRSAAGYASLVEGLTLHSLEVRDVRYGAAQMQRRSFDGVPECRHQCLVEVMFHGPATEAVDAARDFARLWRDGRTGELTAWERSLAARAAWHDSPEFY